MSDKNTSYKVKVQAILDKVKSLSNLKTGLKALEKKIKVKIKGAMDSKIVKRELDKDLKSIKPRVKIEADTTGIEQSIRKLEKQKSDLVIRPTLDNEKIIAGLEEAKKEAEDILGGIVQTGVNVSVPTEMDGADSQLVSAKKRAEEDWSVMEDLNAKFPDFKEIAEDIAEALEKFNLLESGLLGLDKIKEPKDLLTLPENMMKAGKSTIHLTSVMNMLNHGLSTGHLEAVGQACLGLSDNQLKAVLSANELTEAHRLDILAGMGLERQEAMQKLATLGLAGAQEAATLSAFSLRGAIKALGVAFKSNPIGAIISALTAVMTITTTVMSYHKKKQEEAAQALKDAKASIEEYQSKIDDMNKKLSDHKNVVGEAKESYATLAKGVNTFNNTNVNLSTEDYERFIETNNKLAELFPELKTGIDSEGNAILGLGDNADIVAEKLDALIKKEELANARDIWHSLADNFDDVYTTIYQPDGDDGLDDQINEKQEEITKYKDKLTALEGADISLDMSWDKNNRELTEYYVYLKNVYDKIVNDISELNVAQKDLLRTTAKFDNGNGTLKIDKDAITTILNNYNIDSPFANADSILNQFYAEAEAYIRDINAHIWDLENDNASLQDQVDSYWGEYKDAMSQGMIGAYQYLNAENDEQRKIMQFLVGNLDTSAMEVIEEDYDGDTRKFLSREVLGFADDIEKASGDLEFEISDLIDMSVDADTLGDNWAKIKQYFEDNHIDINWDLISMDDDVEDTNKAFKKMVVGSDKDDETTNKKYKEFLNEQEELAKLTVEQKKKYLEINDGVKDTEEQLQRWRNYLKKIADHPVSVSLSFNGFTEAQNKEIDNFQSKAKTLGDALASIQSGDTSGVTDLIQQFPELAGQTGHLEQAIQSLIYGDLDKLYATLGEGLPTEIEDDLQSIADAATGVAPDLNQAISAIQKSNSAMREFKDVMAGGQMTGSVLSNVGALSTTLYNMAIGFQSGTVSADQLYNALTEHYNNDVLNYKNAFIAKNQYNEDFYTAVGLASAEVTNQFMEDYGVDLTNCKNYNQAKLKIEEETLRKTSSAWKQYYTVYDAVTNTYSASVMDALRESAAHGDAQAQAQLSTIEAQTNRYEAAIAALDGITYDKIETNFDSISTSFSDKGAGSSPASQQQEATGETFNFIETLLNRLSSAFEKFKAKGADAFQTLTARAGSYEAALSVVEKQINAQQQAQNTYMEKAYAVGLDEYWAAQVRDGSLALTDVTDDGLKEKIKEYQEWYEKALACGEAVEDLKREQTELAQAKIELLVTQYDNLLEKLSGKNDRIQGRIDLKEAWGFSAGKANYKNMNKNLQQQIAYTIEQNRELENLKSTVKEGSEAWYEYNKRIDANNASLQEMKKTMAENAKAAAALAGETAASKAEKQDDKKELFDAKMDNATTAKRKNKLIDKKSRAIDRQQDAYDDAVAKDKKNLNSAKRAIKNFKGTKENKSLLKSLKKYTKSGKIIPKDFLDKAEKLNDNGKLYNACVQYNAYLEAYNTDKAAAELFAETSKQEKADLAMEKFDNIAAEYDNQIAADEQKKTLIQNQISQAESQGKKPTTSYYKELLDVETAGGEKLVKKREAMQKSLNEAVAAGTIQKGSEEWYQMIEEINEVTNAIDASNQSVLEYNNQIRQIRWDAFDRGMESAKRLNSETEYYLSLLDKEKMTDENGNFTDYGKTSLALHNVNYESYMEQARGYAKEYQDLMTNADLSDEKVIQRMRELEDAQRDARLAAEDEKQAIVDLVRQGYEAQLDSLSELIQKYKDLKHSEKDAYDYEKTISEKTKNIANLQKQLHAYGANDTEEARAKVQKLKVELEEAQRDLEETEYDKYLSDMDNMLDELYANYESFVNDKLDDTNELLGNIEGLIGDTNTVLETLNGLVAGLGSGGEVSKDLTDAVTSSTGAREYTHNTTEAEKAAAESAPPVTESQPGNSGNASNAHSVYEPLPDSREQNDRHHEVFTEALTKQQKEAAVNFIKKNVDDAQKVAKNKKREDFSALNQVIYDNQAGFYKGKGKVLPGPKMKELAALIGIKHNNGNKDGNLYQKLRALGIKGFADGSRRIEQDQLALTQERGEELIFRSSDSAMFTPLGAGDMVFTDEMSKNLWDISKIPPQELMKHVNIAPVLPDMPTSVLATVNNQRVGDIHIDMGGITMNGVNDPAAFAEELNRQLSSNPKTIGILQLQSVDAVSSSHNYYDAVNRM